jgi:hypothetical protein
MMTIRLSPLFPQQSAIERANSVATSPQANYTDRGLPRLEKLMSTFAGRGYCMVRVTDP